MLVLRLLGCTPPAQPLVAQRLVPGDAAVRGSAGDVTRPVWTPGEVAVLERSAAPSARIELHGVGPADVVLRLRRDGEEIALPARATGPEGAWRRFEADASAVPRGRWTVELDRDGWLASRPVLFQDADEPRPNVLIVAIDTLRADHLGCYGHDRPTSPAIDAFAAGSTLFERAASQASWTLPSFATLLTGRYPESHGVVHRDQRLNRSLVSVVERFAEAGYVTGAVASGTFTDADWGFDQGFDAYDDLGSMTGDREAMIEAAERRITSEQVTDRAIAWLRAQQGRRFFLLAHYFDPHSDFVEHPDVAFPAREVPWRMRLTAAPQPAGVAADAARYAGEIAYTDRHVGRLLDFLRDQGTLDETVVVITADHGEEFHERLKAGHGHGVFGELVRVPLIVRVPGARPGRVATPVGLVDLAPTLTALCGLEALPAEGRSLVPMVRDPSARRGAPVHAAGWAPNPPSEVRVDAGRGRPGHHRVETDEGTLVVLEQGPGAPATFWFDAADREERTDLRSSHAELARALDDAYRAERAALLAGRPAVEALDLRPIASQLEALGYAE